MKRILPLLLALAAASSTPAHSRMFSTSFEYMQGTTPTKDDKTPAPKAAPKGVPDKVLKVLEYVDKHGAAMEGYEGGRSFGNFERRLPQTDDKKRRIKYREWDVNPLRPRVNRGPQRLITGSDGSAYYTDDHYDTFKKIR
jgi:guanyl-specific ribonuclease Sa